MTRISAFVVVVPVLWASAAAAQINAAPREGTTPTGQAHVQQQAMASDSGKRAADTFIIDEYGNVYDGRGDIIKPRPLTR